MTRFSTHFKRNLRPPSSVIFLLLICSVNHLILPAKASDTPSNQPPSSYENSHDLLNLHLLEDDEEKSTSGKDDCRNPTLTSFLRSFKLAPFLPDDYKRVTKSMNLGSENQQGNIYDRVKNFTDTLQLVDRLLTYGDKVSENEDLQGAIKYLTTSVIDMMYSVRVSPECQADLMRVAEAARQKQIWAWKFADSFGSVHVTGLLQGVLASFGEFTQCTSIKSPPYGLKKRTIYGRYCQLQVASILPPPESYKSAFESQLRRHRGFKWIETMLKQAKLDAYLTSKTQIVKFASELDRLFSRKYFQYGVCFPNRCTPADIGRIVNRFLYPITKMPIKVDPALCDDHEEIKAPQQKELEVFQLASKILFCGLALLVLFATAYEAFLLNCCDSSPTSGHHHVTLRQQSTLSALSTLTTDEDNPDNVYNSHSTGMQLFLAFSAIGNSVRLGATGNLENRFPVVDTFRAASIFAVCTHHSLIATLPLSLAAIKGYGHTAPTEIFHQNVYWFSRTPGLWADLLLFTVGFTVLVSQFRKLKTSQGAAFNYLAFILLPWARLAILMAAVVAVIWWLPVVGKGPMWHLVRRDLAGSCTKAESLLPNFLLYGNWLGVVSNYTEAMTCNHPTWFFGTAAQLYIITPLIFLSLYYCPSFGLGTTIAVLILTPILVLYPLIFENIPSYFELTKLYSLTDLYRSFTHYHFSPVQYVPAISAGLLTGYLVVKRPNLKMVMGGRKMAILLWLALSGALVGVFVWHCTFWKVNVVANSASVAAWMVISKLVLLAWVSYTVYVCCTGRCATLSALFTIRWAQPIARLSTSIYLLRTVTMFWRLGSPQHTYELTLWHTTEHMITDYLLTVTLAYLLYLLLEGPVLRVIKVLRGRQSKTTKAPANDNHKATNGTGVNRNGSFKDCPVTLKLGNGKREHQQQ